MSVIILIGLARNVLTAFAEMNLLEEPGGRAYKGQIWRMRLHIFAVALKMHRHCN